MRKDKTIVNKKYVRYKYKDVYAIYYYSNNTVYYNLNFDSETQRIVFKRG